MVHIVVVEFSCLTLNRLFEWAFFREGRLCCKKNDAVFTKPVNVDISAPKQRRNRASDCSYHENLVKWSFRPPIHYRIAKISGSNIGKVTFTTLFNTVVSVWIPINSLMFKQLKNLDLPLQTFYFFCRKNTILTNLILRFFFLI